MKNYRSENNRVSIIGVIAMNPMFNHELFGEKFYVTNLRVIRSSGTYDFVPIMISEKILRIKYPMSGDLIKVRGQFRSHNRHEDGRSKLELFVFVTELDFADETGEGREANGVYLKGYICKKPVYRKTPLGREIADLFIAVNRSYGKSDYIPCICWGRNALFTSSLNIGERVEVNGRIQSREYIKKISETELEKRIAYEVSVRVLEVADED